MSYAVVDCVPDQVGVLDFSRAQLDSSCRELEQQYGVGKVLRLLCDVTDHDKLVFLRCTYHDAVQFTFTSPFSPVCISSFIVLTHAGGCVCPNQK